MSSYDKNQAYSTEWSDDEQPATYSGNENGGNGNSFEDDTSTGKGVRVRALYDYEGQEQDELSFKAGSNRTGYKILSARSDIMTRPSGGQNHNSILIYMLKLTSRTMKTEEVTVLHLYHVSLLHIQNLLTTQFEGVHNHFQA